LNFLASFEIEDLLPLVKLPRSKFSDTSKVLATIEDDWFSLFSKSLFYVSIS